MYRLEQLRQRRFVMERSHKAQAGHSKQQLTPLAKNTRSRPPGDCVPCLRQTLPLECDAAFLEAATAVGLVFLLP